jgi:hypothetical protein
MTQGLSPTSVDIGKGQGRYPPQNASVVRGSSSPPRRIDRDRREIHEPALRLHYPMNVPRECRPSSAGPNTPALRLLSAKRALQAFFKFQNTGEAPLTIPVTLLRHALGLNHWPVGI